MKKIAFVSSGFTGSILPLVNRLIEKGYSVDLYLLIFKSQNQNEFEALEQNSGSFGYGIHYIPNNHLKGIQNLFNADKFRFFLICNFGLGGNSVFKAVLAKSLQSVLADRIANQIKNRDYALINVIGHDLLALQYSKRLKGTHLFHTFHEVYLHGQSNFELINTVREVMNLGTPIIVPSKHLFDMIKITDKKYPAYIIPFGLFETYRLFVPDAYSLPLPERYLLFLGNVLPYKGLDMMYKAQQILRKKGKSINIVIAGNGHSDLIEQIKNDSDYTVINRWISNSEIAELIVRSQGVVCPYLSASQSGIPPTAWVFGKKVIVTDVGAMNEYVEEDSDGYIIPPKDPVALSEAMLKLYENNGTIEDIELVQQRKKHDWQHICELYLKLVGLPSIGGGKFNSRKIYNFFYKTYNNYKFKKVCTKMGGNLWAINRVHVENRGGVFQIGKDCCVLSEPLYNPLICNSICSIVVNRGAELIIGDNVGISSTTIWCHEKIFIGDKTTIGAMTLILDSDCHSLNPNDRWTGRDMFNKHNAPIIIGRDVLIGTRCVILKGVTIGDRCVIAAGSIVTKDIPADSVAAGNPARVVKQLKWN